MAESYQAIHDRQAPYWALTLIILGSCGLATIWLDLGPFWSGYVLDMCGPGWNYILFRGLFTAYDDNVWIRIFTPGRTFTLFVIVSFGIEGAQFLELYDSTFDPWDLLAYVSILLPLYLVDLRTVHQAN